MSRGDGDERGHARDDAMVRLQQALGELAASDARELIDEARAQAQTDVRELLGRALRESMLRVIETELRPDADATPGLPAAASASASPAVYVYGVVSAGSELGGLPPGVDGSGLVVEVTEVGLTALISAVAGTDFDEHALRAHMADMTWVQDTARRHERVIEAVAVTATVIPMRMCTVYPSEREVRELLRRDARALREALRHLAGKTEWGVKVFTHRTPRVGPERRRDAEATARATGLSPTTGVAAAAAGERRALRAARADAARRAEDAAGHVHEVLCAVAGDALIVPPHAFGQPEHGGELLLNGVYLVADVEQEDFRAQARSLSRSFSELGIELEITGPWPAYNFVPGTIGAAW